MTVRRNDDKIFRQNFMPTASFNVYQKGFKLKILSYGPLHLGNQTVSALVLICLKSLKSTASSPVGLVTDDIANCCHASTFLQTKVRYTLLYQVFIKGQLISECLLGVIDFPKKQRKI